MKKKIEAYFSVEAAFIFPIIVIFTIAAIWLCLFLLNRLKFEADTEYIMTIAEKHIIEGYVPDNCLINYSDKLDRTVFYPLEDADDMEMAIIRDAAKKQFSEGYLMGKITDIDVTVNHSSVSVKAVLKMNAGTSGLTGRLTNSFNKVTYSRKRDFIDRGERQRGIDIALQTGEKIKGADKVIDGIKKIFEYIN